MTHILTCCVIVIRRRSRANGKIEHYLDFKVRIILILSLFTIPMFVTKGHKWIRKIGKTQSNLDHVLCIHSITGHSYYDSFDRNVASGTHKDWNSYYNLLYDIDLKWKWFNVNFIWNFTLNTTLIFHSNRYFLNINTFL